MRSIRSTPTGRRPLSGLGTEWLDQRAQRQPRHNRPHLGKERPPAASSWRRAQIPRSPASTASSPQPTRTNPPRHTLYTHRSRLLQRHLSQSAECGENEKGVFLFVISCLSNRLWLFSITISGTIFLLAKPGRGVVHSCTDKGGYRGLSISCALGER